MKSKLDQWLAQGAEALVAAERSVARMARVKGNGELAAIARGIAEVRASIAQAQREQAAFAALDEIDPKRGKSSPPGAAPSARNRAGTKPPPAPPSRRSRKSRD